MIWKKINDKKTELDNSLSNSVNRHVKLKRKYDEIEKELTLSRVEVTSLRAQLDEITAAEEKKKAVEEQRAMVEGAIASALNAERTRVANEKVCIVM